MKIKIIFILITFFLLPILTKADELQKLVEDIGAIYSPQPAPDGFFSDLKGKIYRLADFKGKVILLNFWTTWCPICRMQLPYLKKIYQKYQTNSQFAMLLVGIEKKETLRKFQKRYNYSLPFYSDEKKVLASRYFVTAVPTTFIIDREFKIIAKIIGLRKEEINSLAKILDKLLEKNNGGENE